MEPTSQQTLQQFIKNTKFAFIDVNPEDFDKKDLILDFFGFENTKYGNTDFYKQEKASELFQIYPTVKSSTITIDSKQFIWNMRLGYSSIYYHLTHHSDSELKTLVGILLEDILNRDTDIELYHTMDNHNLFITYIGYI